MTTGNKTWDHRQTVYVWNPYSPGTVALKVGAIRKKKWTGQDWSEAYPPPKPVPSSSDSPLLGILHTRPPRRARREEHAYSCSGSFETTPLCFADHKTTKNMFRVSNVWANANLTPLAYPAASHLALIGRLHTAVAGSDFNAGVFLGEGVESLKMISANATKVYHSLRLVKRGRFGEARRVLTGYGSARRIKQYDNPDWIDSVPFLKRDGALRQYDRDISAAWLELSYGWIPLLNDVKSGAEFLAHRLNSPLQQRYVVRNAVQARGPIATSSPNDFIFSDGVKRTSRQIICYVREVSPYQLSGLADPLSVAWELVPWSFVVDWFIPIGRYLSARGAASSLKGDFVTSTYSTVVASGLQAKPSNGNNFASQWILRSGHQQRRIEYFAVTRDVSTNLSVPFPNFTPLGKVPSWSRAANAVALLDQLRPKYVLGHRV